MNNFTKKLRAYNPLAPLKDNLAQVKNAVEAIVALFVANHFTFFQTTLISWFGEDVAIELLALSSLGEALIVYQIISAIEYFVTDQSDDNER